MVGLDQAFIAAFLHCAIAGERIGDRPADDREGEASVRPGKRKGGIARIAWTQRVEQQQVPTRRGAETAHEFGARRKPLCVRFQKTDAEIHIGNGCGITHRRRHAEVDRQHDDAVGREIFADRDVVQPVAGSPRAAVHFEHRGERTDPLGAVEAGEQRRAFRWAQIFKVFAVDGHNGCLGLWAMLAQHITSAA
jgi:hypothetical protein